MNRKAVRHSKACLSCGVDKPYTDYWKLQKGWQDPDGSRRQYHCIDCQKESRKLYRNSRSRKNNALRHKYGIGIDEYEQMLVNQHYRCAGCSVRHTDDVPLRVHHCHVCDKVLLLLCHNCNVVLGLVHEEPKTLLNLVAILYDHSEPSCCKAEGATTIPEGSRAIASSKRTASHEDDDIV